VNANHREHVFELFFNGSELGENVVAIYATKCPKIQEQKPPLEIIDAKA
jgi:hypothetical protein